MLDGKNSHVQKWTACGARLKALRNFLFPPSLFFLEAGKGTINEREKDRYRLAASFSIRQTESKKSFGSFCAQNRRRRWRKNKTKEKLKRLYQRRLAWYVRLCVLRASLKT